LLGVLTAVAGASLAVRDGSHLVLVVHAMIGSALTGGGAGALNQYVERAHDALMKRTENRPLPSKRLQPGQALAAGLAASSGGVAYLALTTTAAAAWLAALTILFYVGVYTPLKRRTPFSTVVGGIPGALPPLIGWAAVRGGLSMEAWSLFFILFFWQMPHFLALGWLYRKDYTRAGYKLITVVDPTGKSAGRQILTYSIALLPAALMPTLVGLSGILYFTAAAAASIAFLWTALPMYREPSNVNARRLFRSSLAYIPVIVCLLLADHLLRVVG
jgi:protoheme IX farnesyltransferase